MLLGYQNGTGIYSVGATLERELQLCEEVGFDVFEIRFDALQRYLVTHSVRELAAFFRNSHIKPHGTGGHFIMPDDLTGTARDGGIMTNFITSCHVAEQIGDKYYLVVNHILQRMTDSGPVDVTDQDYPYSKDEVTDFTSRILRRLCEAAADYGVIISFEPVCGRGSSVKTMAHALEIIEATECSNIGLCPDSFNQFIAGKSNDFSCYSGIPAEKITTVHINNCDDEPLGVLIPQHRRFCDSGAIDLDNFMESLKKIGYDGPVSIETLRPEYYAKPVEWVVREAYRTTRALFDRAGV